MSPPLWETEPVVCLTSDIDWASEEVLKYSHNLISRAGIRITYFVTHESPFISNLIASDQIDVGIHPNFILGSSHGNSFEEVIDNCLKIAPKAKSSRSHKYFEVDDTNDALYDRGIRYDSNLCTLMDPGLKPISHRSRIVRFPIYFEDGSYVKYVNSFCSKQLIKNMMDRPGLLIFNVHPIHMAMNSPDYMYTRRIKDSLSRNEFNQIDENKLRHLRSPSRGISDLISDVLDEILNRGIVTRSLDELYNEYKIMKPIFQ